MTTLSLFAEIERSAVLSECRLYRYSLTRTWDESRERVLFVGLNPSTADENRDDPTLRRCIGFAKRWGYGGLILVNLFAFRATDPSELLSTADPVGPENDAAIASALKLVNQTIVAWGTKGELLNRDIEILKQISQPYCLGKSKNGFPRHPLYMRKSLRPKKYRIPKNRG